MPVFREDGMNHDLVAETDADLRITKFLDLYPNQDYRIEELPYRSQMRQRHSIGDPSPIPFIVDNNIYLIMGDRHPADLDSFLVGSPSATVIINDLKLLLARAREGFFRHKAELWKTERLRSAFPELFEEPPSRSRYWVTRYRVAVSRIENDGTVNQPMADEFRRLGNLWLELFGTKTDFARMLLLFGKADDGVFNRDDVTASAFGFFCHKLATHQFQFLERAVREEAYFLGLFPNGLYYYQAEHGFPKTPFPYNRPGDFLGELKERLYKASDSLGFSKAKNLSLVLFGLKDSPVELRDYLGTLRRQYTSDFRTGKRAFETEFKFVRNTETDRFRRAWEHDIRIQDTAFTLVRAYEALIGLEAIEYGNARLKLRDNDYLAEDRGFVEEIRELLQEGRRSSL